MIHVQRINILYKNPMFIPRKRSSSYSSWNLCTTAHRNIIQGFHHKHLRDYSAFFFIDMELCHVNVDEYMHGKSASMLMVWDEAIDKGWGIFVIYRIMDHVLNGLAYIHSLDKVHRDIIFPNDKDLERN